MKMDLDRVVLLPVAILTLAVFVACKPRKESVAVKQVEPAATQLSPAEPKVDDAAAKALSVARLGLAQAQLESGSADRALCFAISALEADPKSATARKLVAEILGSNSWALPELCIHHGQHIDHLEFRKPSTLWVASSGEWNVVSRWNIDTPSIEAALFPRKDGSSRSMGIAPDGGMLVLEREGQALLCDAQSLKPVLALGRIPEKLSPSSVVVFSDDGLLLAYPALVEADQAKLVWHLRDAKSGEIIRSSEPFDDASRRPLAAYLDRTQLTVLHSDGSSWVMPVSPVEPCRWENSNQAIELKHACFESDGSAAQVLIDRGPHEKPELAMLPDIPVFPDAWNVLANHPWSLQASVWTSLYRHADDMLWVDGTDAWLNTSMPVQLRGSSAITAMHRTDDQWVVARESGDIEFYRIMPITTLVQEPDAAWEANVAFLASLKNFALALTGLSLDADGLNMIKHQPEDRLRSFGLCDFSFLERGLTEIDFVAWREAVGDWKFKSTDASATSVLESRIMDADPDRAGDMKEIEEIFASGDVSRMIESIDGTDSQGAIAAKQLQLALASPHAEVIAACLRRHPSMPPTLHRLAQSRVAWLENRKADAIATWSEPFPEYDEIRRSEDWHGWEQVDFSPAFHAVRDAITAEIELLRLPANATQEQLTELAQRFENPETMRGIGRSRYAKACLDAAFEFVKFKDHAQTALTLATRARSLGHPPEPCLRAEAVALTALGDFAKAHDRWVMLISDFAQSTHESGDYAEAAYTAFELGNARQAMEILITGMHRFPEDANFALRAGWIALLTDHADRAYAFLLSGNKIGYVPEKIANATALMALAAKLSGADDEAAAHYAQLVQVDNSWREAKAIEALEWPDDFKSALDSLRTNSALVRPTR
ncbi:MAG: hypothetical protein RLY69_302 [Verrucomicrobiota bacterium]